MSKRRSQRKSRAEQKSAISPLMIVGVAVAATLLIVLGNQSAQSSSEPVDISQFPTLGEPDAPVTLLEYSDYG